LILVNPERAFADLDPKHHRDTKAATNVASRMRWTPKARQPEPLVKM
jgi:hypothetical protein